MSLVADIDLDWEFDPVVVLPLAVSIALYSVGIRRLWRRAGVGRAVAIWQAAAFFAGMAVLIGALISPLHEYAEHLFSAHMIEHELLMAVAAPLLALSRPLGTFLHAFAPRARRALVRAARHGAVQRTWTLLLKPHVATILHAIAIWIWHIPALLDATIVNETLHRAQHVSFLGTALIFWWSMLRVERRAYGVSAAHVFATMVHTTLLGALIALAPRVLYPEQTADASLFGLAPLQDQQLAGLLMWVPCGVIYFAAALALAYVWIFARRDRGLRTASKLSIASNQA
jgi:putative membrane protein